MKRRWLLAVAIILALGVLGAQAEVAVEKDDDGAYKALRVVMQDRGPWTPDPSRPDDDYLNPDGDDSGDGAPSAIVLPAGTFAVGPTPLVAWSHFDGMNHDIYYSAWHQSTGWLAPKRLTDHPADDLDPVLLLDPTGEGQLAWWRDTAPRRVVMMSCFETGGEWEAAELVSGLNQDAWGPRLDLIGNVALVVTYFLGDGPGTCSIIKERFDPE